MSDMIARGMAARAMTSGGGGGGGTTVDAYNKQETDSLLRGKANASDVYTITQTDGLLDDKVDKVDGKRLSTNDFTDEEKNKLSALENYDDSGITKSIEDLEENKANKNEVYNKEETDTKITEKVAEIVAGAPEEFNTLKEMSDWLTEHEDSAATMNTAILKNKDDIADNTEAIEQNKSDILKVQRHSATMGMSNQGWFRIAECIIGQGRSAILRLERTYGNNPTEIITLLINVAYNVASQPFFDCNILDKYVKSSLLKKLRIVIPTELSVSSKMYIDVWNDGTSSNGLRTTIFGESVLTSSIEPITILNPTIAPELPEGYTSKEFDLTVGDVFDRLTSLETALSQTQTE